MEKKSDTKEFNATNVSPQSQQSSKVLKKKWSNVKKIAVRNYSDRSGIGGGHI